MDIIINQLTKEFSISAAIAKNTINLIDEGNTIPFIARYRKEVTNNMSDVTLRDFHARYIYLTNLENRKAEVKNLIEKQGKLTEELIKQIDACLVLKEVEDIYLPFKPKKRTKATIAKEKGLETLANYIYLGKYTTKEINEYAKSFINEEKEVKSASEAINGALDIIAESISEDASFRKNIRKLSLDKALITSKVKKEVEEERNEFENYYDYTESIRTIQNHRILALNRGESKDVLKVSVTLPDDDIIYYLYSKVKGEVENDFLLETVKDAYKRLISKSIERELRSDLTAKAEENAIKVFGKNLHNLLLVPPVKGKVILGFDPAYRTGCKIAIINPNGKVLDTTTIYPTKPQEKVEESKKILKDLINKHNVEIISIGNGTASRESEVFVASLIKELDKKVEYIVVSEAGASVYSASKLANEEYPKLNVSLRGAISIAQRLKDPLAELVKIDPKHIGVGQYQHDVNQKELEGTLSNIVEDAVNSVGVDVNTASASLLSYIAGISKKTANNISEYVKENNGIKNRNELLSISGVGQKAFTQCAGFLRVSNSDNILDNTAVHPESYGAVYSIFNNINTLTIDELKKEVEKIEVLDLKEVAKNSNIGVATLTDILAELKKPGRDPRDELEKVTFQAEIMELEDLVIGSILTGTIRNITNFGAFVDIGLHDDGLVHISQLSDKFVKDPFDIVSIGDIVKVKVIDVDFNRKRVSLSMKGI